MRRNVLLVTLVVAVAALTVVVVRQRGEISDLKQTAQVVPAKAAVPAEPPAASPKQEPSPAPEPPPAAPDAAASTPAPPAGKTGSDGKNFMAGLAGMMKSPGMKEMVRAQQKP